MYRAMALKEFREIRGIVLLAAAGYALLAFAAMAPASPWNILAFFRLTNAYGGEVPFVRDDFVGKFYFVSVIFTIALGLRQSLGESVRGTYPFLLHRPADRHWLIGMKLAVGTAAYLICTLVPILVYACWAATPGTHASPFEWSMTLPICGGWLAMTILYLGAFHTGVRPGRWLRSRILPLVASAIATIGAMGLVSVFQGILWPCVIGVLVVDVWLIAMILFAVRTRDYP